jgi:membrane-associated PAP2 superfamily phosphatase
MKLPARLSWLDRSLWFVILVFAIVFLLLEYTAIDLWVQDHFFDFDRGRWLVDGRAPLPRLLLYTGPKVLIILFGLWVFCLVLLPEKWRGRWPLASIPRRSLWVLFFTIGLVPWFIGELKQRSNTFCPSEIRRYGGDVPYVKVVECYPENDRPGRKGDCFPAGHASGGFALMALAGVARTRRGQWLGLGFGLAAGWLMGGYQMLKGSHYLSHTVVTMFMAWIGFLLLRRLFRVHRLPAV